MNKTFITIMATAALALNCVAASSQTSKAPPGMDNISFGYGAGYQSSGQNTNVICIGTDAGMGTSGNTDCIFIGKEAGKNISGATGYVDIGGVFKKNSNGVSIGGYQAVVYDPFENKFRAWNGTDVSPTIIGAVADSDNEFATDAQKTAKFAYYSGYIRIEGSPYSSESIGIQKSNGKYRIYSSTSGTILSELGAYIKFDNGSLCVYTNDVKVGTLAFTPVQ